MDAGSSLQVGDRIVWRTSIQDPSHTKDVEEWRATYGDGPFVVETIELKPFTLHVLGSKPDPTDTHILTASSNGKILALKFNQRMPMSFSSYWFEKVPERVAEEATQCS